MFVQLALIVDFFLLFNSYPTKGGMVTSKLEDGKFQVQTPVVLVDLLFGVFRGFLRNSFKYRLGSLRKTPMESIPPTVPSPTSEQLDLSLQPTNQPTNQLVATKYKFS